CGKGSSEAVMSEAASAAASRSLSPAGSGGARRSRRAAGRLDSAELSLDAMDLRCPCNRAVWGRVIEPHTLRDGKGSPDLEEAKRTYGDRCTEALHARSVRQRSASARGSATHPGAPTQSGVLSGSLLLEILLPLPA